MTELFDIPTHHKMDVNMIKYQAKSSYRDVWTPDMKVIGYGEYEFTYPPYLYRVVISDDKDIKVTIKGKEYNYETL